MRRRGQWWIMVWCFLVLLLNIAALLLGKRGSNNLWLLYVGDPLMTTALLWALAHWHPIHTARVALKAAIPLVLMVSVGLTLAFDDRHSFSLVVAPFHAILMLLAVLWTFIALGMRADHGSLAREDWFWIVGGVMLYVATATAMQPLAWYLIRERVDLLHAAFNLRAAIVLLSFGAITWGMLRGRKYSGGYSLPPSSPSSFSSPASPLP